MSGLMRTRWAAIGAAVAVTLGAGGIGLAHAVVDSGVRNVVVPIDPCRLVDNRTAPDTVGDSDDPLPAGSAVTFDAFGTNGNCTLPNGFEGLIINVTPVNATANTDIRLYPTGGAVPLSSNLNPEAGTLPIPNLVTVGLNDQGQFDVLNKFGTVNIVIDVLAYLDDHHHDDRYPTATYSAVVNENGQLSRGVGAIDAESIGVGNYSVTFDRDVSQCVYSATPGPVADTAVVNRIATVASLNNEPNGVFVLVAAPNGAAAATPFHLVVVCPAGT